MKLLFKPATTAKPDTVVKSTNFPDHYPAIHSQLRWKTIEPVIYQAVRSYVIPMIGQDLYDEYADNFNGANDFTGDKADAMAMLKDVCAYYTMLDLIPSQSAIVGEMGVQEIGSTDASSNPSSQWRYNELLSSVGKKADGMMDALLEYLEEKVAEGSTDFNNWKDHKVYTSLQSDFFRSTSQLNEVLHIDRSRRTFRALLFYLKNAERRYILPLLGEAFYTEIVADIKGSSIPDKRKHIIHLARVAIASRAVDEGAPRMVVDLSAEGFRVVTRMEGLVTKRNMANADHMKALEGMRFQARRDAEKAEADIERYLYDNIDHADLATFKSSDTAADDIELDQGLTTPSDGIGGGGIL